MLVFDNGVGRSEFTGGICRMFNSGWRQHIEDRQTSLEASVNDLRGDVGAIGSKIDKLVSGLSDTGERAAQRAHAVKTELRDEGQRKAQERGDLLKNGLALMGGVALLVSALVGPYKGQLETTTIGQRADTVAVAAVREVLAQQGAGIGRNQAAIDIQRENAKIRDAELREHDQDIAFLKGELAVKGLQPH